jgi:hypothetical protein
MHLIQGAAEKLAIVKIIKTLYEYLLKYSVWLNYCCLYNRPFFCRILYNVEKDAMLIGES